MGTKEKHNNKEIKSSKSIAVIQHGREVSVAVKN